MYKRKAYLMTDLATSHMRSHDEEPAPDGDEAPSSRATIAEPAAAVLERLEDTGWQVMHDRLLPSAARLAIDHLAVGPGGIFVIDSHSLEAAAASSGVSPSSGVVPPELLNDAHQIADGLRGLLPPLSRQYVVCVLSYVDLSPMSMAKGPVQICTTSMLQRVVETRRNVLSSAEIDDIVAVLDRGLGGGSGAPTTSGRRSRRLRGSKADAPAPTPTPAPPVAAAPVSPTAPPPPWPPEPVAVDVPPVEEPVAVAVPEPIIEPIVENVVAPEPVIDDIPQPEEFRDNLRDVFDTATTEAADIPLEAVPYRPDRTPEPAVTKDDEYRDEYIDWSLVELPRKAAVEADAESAVDEVVQVDEVEQVEQVEPAEHATTTTSFADIIDELTAPVDAPRFEIESVEPSIEAAVEPPAAPERAYLEDDELEVDADVPEAQADDTGSDIQTDDAAVAAEVSRDDIPVVQPLGLDDLDVDSYASPALFDRSAPSFDEQPIAAAAVDEPAESQAVEPEPEPDEAPQYTSSAANDIAREIAALEEAYETAHAESSWMQTATTAPAFEMRYDGPSLKASRFDDPADEGAAPAAPKPRVKGGARRKAPSGPVWKRIAPRRDKKSNARPEPLTLEPLSVAAVPASLPQPDVTITRASRNEAEFDRWDDDGDFTPEPTTLARTRRAPRREAAPKPARRAKTAKAKSKPDTRSERKLTRSRSAKKEEVAAQPAPANLSSRGRAMYEAMNNGVDPALINETEDETKSKGWSSFRKIFAVAVIAAGVSMSSLHYTEIRTWMSDHVTVPSFLNPDDSPENPHKGKPDKGKSASLNDDKQE